jgi:2-methylisocitrate lyase-like PEP mutase family enzyme
MDADARRARFAELHARDELFVMPNPWDAGSARLLASLGFEALATTSQGFAWSLGLLDQEVSRDELIAHVRDLSAATELPLNVDSERCYPDDPGGVTETVALLANAGGAGFSIEDYDPVADRIDDIGLAAERVREAAEANRSLSTPLVLTGRAENHIRGVQNLDDTIARLIAYREAGADAVYAPGLRTIEEIRTVVDAVRCPVNVLSIPGTPTIAELGAAGVRRVSTGSALASRAFGALYASAKMLREKGSPAYAEGGLPGDAVQAAFRARG